MYKKDIINILFIASFSIYGVGNYIAASMSPTIGLLITISGWLLIIAFFLLDAVYRREFKMNFRWRLYGLMTLFTLSTAASLYVAYYKGLPNTNLAIVTLRALLQILPFQAFVIVLWYNRNSDKKFLVRSTMLALTIMLFINLLGFMAGLQNAGHGFEGRLNLPFFPGIYTAAGMMLVMNLVFIRQIGRMWTDPGRWVWRVAFVLLNLVLVYFINSRLTMMVFLLVLAFTFLRLIRTNLVFWLSMFTLPIVLSLRYALYQILSLPAFVAVMQRVDFEDVTSFNGRAYLWEIGMHWLLEDQRGLLFGNGYGGQYFLDLLTFYARLWSGGKSDTVHFHSSSLEIAVNQGMLAFILFAYLLFRIFKYYRAKYFERHPDGDFYVAIIYMLFVLHIDTFVYMGLGAILFGLLMARLVVKEEEPSKNVVGEPPPMEVLQVV
jgi:hypothetical protein